MKRAIFFILICLYSQVGLSQGSKPLLKDIALESGLNFVHFNGMTGNYYFPEMTGQGGALFDMDQDGDLDLYLVQGAILAKKEQMKDALFPSKEPRPKDRLFRNDLIRMPDGTVKIHFVDITDSSGLNVTSYGMGATAADFNNDGLIDLYITNYGKNQMFFQDTPGHFKEVTDWSGVGNELWGTSAAAFDYDKDGWLDLYVANYVEFDVNVNNQCFANSSRRDYCGPASFPPQKDVLYHNLGDGRFENVTDKMLSGYESHSGLGVTTIDANGDGWLDLTVCNDGQVNQLWINEGGQLFRDDGLFSGIALNMDGNAEASMGIASGDIDGDGDEDIFMAHLMGETNTLYINDGTGLFQDQTMGFGLSAASFPYTSFGVNLIDINNDNFPDLFIASGAVRIIEKQAQQGDPYPLHQPNQFYLSHKGKSFEDISTQIGPDISISEVSRGSAMGDIDNDGDSDIVVFNNNGPVRLFQNQTQQKNNWIGLRLWDTKLKRDSLGSVVKIYQKNERLLVKRVKEDGSYCSTNDTRILFGVLAPIEKVEVYWPDGSVESWSSVKLNTYSTLEKGKGEKVHN